MVTIHHVITILIVYVIPPTLLKIQVKVDLPGDPQLGGRSDDNGMMNLPGGGTKQGPALPQTPESSPGTPGSPGNPGTPGNSGTPGTPGNPVTPGKTNTQSNNQPSSKDPMSPQPPGTSNPDAPNPGAPNPGASNPGAPNPGAPNPGAPGNPNTQPNKQSTSNQSSKGPEKVKIDLQS